MAWRSRNRRVSGGAFDGRRGKADGTIHVLRGGAVAGVRRRGRSRRGQGHGRPLSVAGRGGGRTGARLGEGEEPRDHADARQPGVLQGPAQAPARRLRFRRPDSLHRQAGRALLQLLARQGASARAVAAHHAGVLRRRRAGLGTGARLGRAGEEGRRELGAGRLLLPRTGLPPLPGAALQRRRRCRSHPRVRLANQGFRARRGGRLHVAGSQGHGRLGWRERHLRRHGLRPRQHDRIRLSAHRQAVAARAAAGCRADCA